MSACRYDYSGYHRTWLSKSDLTPKTLKKYGINTTCKVIEENYLKCRNGYVLTGGMGYVKKVWCYSLILLKEYLDIKEGK